MTQPDLNTNNTSEETPMIDREITTGSEPRPGARSRRMSNEDKAVLLFNALSDHHPRTRKELQDISGLSAVQFRTAWFTLKRTLNGLCIVQPARERSTYLLAEAGDEDEARTYQLWQARRILRSLSSLQATITQMGEHDRVHGGFGKGPLTAARIGVSEAQKSIQQLMYSVGGELAISDEHLKKMVAETLA